MRWIVAALIVAVFAWADFAPQAAWADVGDRMKGQLQDAKDDVKRGKKDAKKDVKRDLKH